MILVGLSDTLSQILTKSTMSRYLLRIDRRDRFLRLFRFIAWGCLFGVIGHFYITFINYYIPGKSLGDIFLKVVIDQVGMDFNINNRQFGLHLSMLCSSSSSHSLKYFWTIYIT